ncbi:MAG: hypothetical protein MUO63_22155 [Desulfobulbaceae bacterium]|nr:hypothetical protein [Desulfobulbaceae bacterium]
MKQNSDPLSGDNSVWKYVERNDFGLDHFEMKLTNGLKRKRSFQKIILKKFPLEGLTRVFIRPLQKQVKVEIDADN